MEQKKATKAQLQRKIDNALLHIDKTKDTQSIFFSDKGVRITVNEDYAIIATGYHRSVFDNITSSGISRPWLYTKRFLEIAIENDCKTAEGYSYAKLFESLKAKEEKAEYNIAVFFDWWLQNCFLPLYSIGESEAEAFLVYESYLHNIARQSVILSEKTEDLTNKQFFEAVIKNMQQFIEGTEERVIFPKKTDEEVLQENISAIQEQEQEQAMEAQIDGSEN